MSASASSRYSMVALHRLEISRLFTSRLQCENLDWRSHFEVHLMSDSLSTSFIDEDFKLLDAYWRAANFLTIGQIYLMANPLLRQPLRPEDIKPRLLGHWGTTPGLNLLYAHLNRVIRNWDLDMIFVAGPGHGGPGLVANAYLEGTYTERYPNITGDAAGLTALMRQFSFPGGIGSHATPEVPGSIHEGGELGDALAPAHV